MWISKKRYRFLKENAEKNIELGCTSFRMNAEELAKIMERGNPFD